MDQTVFDTLARADVPAGPLFQAHSIKFMKGLAASCAGIAFLSRFDIAEESGRGALVRVRAVNKTLADNHFSPLRRAKRQQNNATSLFTGTLDAALTAHVPSRWPGA